MASSRGRWSSPERTMVWTETKPKPNSTSTSISKPKSNKVPVVYYLCRRNGHLDHPHFLEVALDHDGRLYLRNVTDRLNALRGEGMAAAYSWSSKRSYKNNGYVWHDLTTDDLILPAHANVHEYVLKGSELLLLQPPPLPAARDASASSSSNQDTCRRRKNWSSFDLGDYRRTAEADAATQTMDDRRNAVVDPASMELGIDEISPPPSSTSTDTLETLIKIDARAAVALYRDREQQAGDSRQEEEEIGVIAGGRIRASTMLMQLISCGSMSSVKDGGKVAAGSAGGDGRFGERFPRGRSDLSDRKEEMSSAGGGMMAERDYLSGSLVETKRIDAAGVGAGELKRSSSYNADRGVSSRLEVTERDGGAKCIPRRQQQHASNNKSTARRRKPMATMPMPLDEEPPPT